MTRGSRNARLTPPPASAAAGPRDHAVDPVADLGRDLEALVEVSQPLELVLELECERGKIVHETEQLVDERSERQREEFDERDDPDDVDDEDRERPAQATPNQPADRRIEQIHEQEAQDEGPDAVARHPENEPDDDRRGDQHGDARGERDELALARFRRPGSRRAVAGATAARSVVEPAWPSATGWAGSSIVGQTSRRASPNRERPAARRSASGASVTARAEGLGSAAETESEAPAEAPPSEPTPTARQRWRVALARSAGAPSLVGRELMDAWDDRAGSVRSAADAGGARAGSDRVRCAIADSG